METVDCPSCNLRFTHANPNHCTACNQAHCRNCLKVFRDEMEESPEARYIVLCPSCVDSISWRIDAQEVVPSNWNDWEIGR